MFVDLDRAFGEIARVLRVNGVGLVYQVRTGPRMSDAEATLFWENDLGYEGAHSVRPADIEAALARAGLDLVRRVDFGGESSHPAQSRCARRR
jgi:hypothetical protein